MNHEQKLTLMVEDAGSNISNGSHQKINIARALLIKPKILLFDYATSSLHEQFKENIFKIIF